MSESGRNDDRERLLAELVEGSGVDRGRIEATAARRGSSGSDSLDGVELVMAPEDELTPGPGVAPDGPARGSDGALGALIFRRVVDQPAVDRVQAGEQGVGRLDLGRGHRLPAADLRRQDPEVLPGGVGRRQDRPP
jgi:hypothetical protein